MYEHFKRLENELGGGDLMRDFGPLMASLSLPVLPLSKYRVQSDHPNVRAAARKGEGHSRQNDVLILGGPPHMVVCIGSKLEYVWWEGFIVIGYAAVLGDVLVKNRVGIACYELGWVYNDEADVRINGIRGTFHEYKKRWNRRKGRGSSRLRLRTSGDGWWTVSSWQPSI